MEKENSLSSESKLLFRQKIKSLFGLFCCGLLDRKELEDEAQKVFKKIKDSVPKNTGDDSK